jgi:DNA adenine methylase
MESRAIRTPIRYAGGKSRAIKHIIKYIPKNVSKIISPFIGGGSLEVYLSNAMDKKVIGYDIFNILINYWQVQLENPEELYDMLNALSPTKETYDKIKDILRKWELSQELFSKLKTNYYEEDSIKLSNIEGAAYYYFNHNLSYGPMYMGWLSSIYNHNIKKYNNMINKVRNFRCPNLSVSQSNFIDVLDNHKNDYLYLDPPYLLDKSNDNKMFKGIYPNPNYAIHHNNFDHKKLRDMLHNHKGKFILSYNNCENIRNWYKDFNLHYPKWQYSYGQGETRIGRNKTNNAPKLSHEILIIKV